MTAGIDRFLHIAFVLLVCFFLSTVNTPRASHAQTPAVITLGKAVGTINPRVYGANYGPWAVVSPDMLPKAWDSGLTFIRYPGGRWGDENNLDDYHLSLLSALVKKGNMEPTINIRLEKGTPGQAVALVQKINGDLKLGVTYWAIGNEPDIYDQPDVTENSKQWRAIALAMKGVDPSIKLIGPEVSQFPFDDSPDSYLQARADWVRDFLKVNGDLVDVVTVHRYPFPKALNAPATTPAELLANVRQWDGLIPALRKLIRETLGRDLPVGITEVNSSWTSSGGGLATPDTFYNAIWWAGVLGTLINQQTDMVTYFNLYTSNEAGSYGMLSRYAPRPTYYVYQMYKRFGTTLYESQSADPELIVIAAKRESGEMSVIVVNLSESAKTFTLTPATALSRTTEVWRFDAEHQAEKLSETPQPDGLFSLPRQSITLYQFQ